MIKDFISHTLWHHTGVVFFFLMAVSVIAGVLAIRLLHFHHEDAFLTGIFPFSHPATAGMFPVAQLISSRTTTAGLNRRTSPVVPQDVWTTGEVRSDR